MSGHAGCCCLTPGAGAIYHGIYCLALSVVILWSLCCQEPHIDAMIEFIMVWTWSWSVSYHTSSNVIDYAVAAKQQCLSLRSWKGLLLVVNLFLHSNLLPYFIPNHCIVVTSLGLLWLIYVYIVSGISTLEPRFAWLWESSSVSRIKQHFTTGNGKT